MVDVNGGNFIKEKILILILYFDNEAPAFHQMIKSFKVSKYCITNGQYLKFVESDGYSKKNIGVTKDGLF